MDSLNSILDTLKAWFGRSLVLLGIVPVALLVTLNLIMIRLLYPGGWRMLRGIYDAQGTHLILLWLGTVLALIAVSFLLLSLNGVIRQVMEGKVLGVSILWFRARQYQRYDRLIAKEKEIRKDLFVVRGFRDDMKPDLQDARDEGRAKPGNGPSKTTLMELQEETYNLEKGLGSRKSVNNNKVETAFDALKNKLAEFSADNSPELNNLHIRFNDVLDAAVEHTEIRWQKLVNERQQFFPSRAADVEATAMANIGKAHRDYLLRTYGFDIEVFWIGLLKYVQADEKFGPILDDAKTQLDFSVAMTAVFALFTLPWTVLTALHPGDLAYILVGVGGGVLVSLAYQAALQNFRAFNEAVKSAVDLHRFDLLRGLHLELPATLADERECWRWLADRTGTPQFDYTHTKPDV